MTRPRPSTAADVPVLIETIAAAFHDDPTMVWIAPDDERRRAIGTVVFGPFVGSIQSLGDTWMTEDGAAAALWVPPGRTVPGSEDGLGEQVAAVLEADELGRLGALNAVIEANTPDEPHAHLNLLGTVPEHQGQGLGSSLLEAVLPRLDRDGIPAYLEATTDRNRRLYERHGFVHWNDIAPEGVPVLRRMWRDPR